MKSPLVQLSQDDNVHISLHDTYKFKRGFKYASSDLLEGTRIIKCGNIIGRLLSDVKAYELVHTHNLSSEGVQADNKSNKLATSIIFEECVELFPNVVQGGYGTKKNILIISTVSCVNRVVMSIARKYEHLHNLGVDVIPIIHNTGCGMVVGSTDHRRLSITLEGYARNPNTFLSIFVGLGCEDNRFYAPYDCNSFFDYVQHSGESQLIDRVSDIVSDQLETILNIETVSRSFSDVVFGLQCGGSDSFSALTANPLLGYTTSTLLGKDATVILSETPEVRGFEDNLMDLCKHSSDKYLLQSIFRSWDSRKIGISNPAPGNLDGGLSTNLEKSMGSILKFGFNKIDTVVGFAEKIPRENGMVFMDSPGYDPCSITGQIASGATCLLFTTGRGSNYINSFLPTIKILSNSKTNNLLSEFIDIDAEALVASGDFRAATQQVLSVIQSKINDNSENASGIIHSDFVPWLEGGIN